MARALAARADLGCGCAGRGYALLNLNKVHLRNGMATPPRVPQTTPQRPRPLNDPTRVQGAPGVAALIADLALPEGGRMPWFE